MKKYTLFLVLGFMCTSYAGKIAKKPNIAQRSVRHARRQCQPSYNSRCVNEWLYYGAQSIIFGYTIWSFYKSGLFNKEPDTSYQEFLDDVIF